MATSVRQFSVGLYREHLEEASCLYGQRRAYFHDPEVHCPDLVGREDRFEAHIADPEFAGAGEPDLELRALRRDVLGSEDERDGLPIPLG